MIYFIFVFSFLLFSPISITANHTENNFCAKGQHYTLSDRVRSIDTLSTVLGIMGIMWSTQKIAETIDRYTKDENNVTWKIFFYRVIESTWRLFCLKLSILLLTTAWDDFFENPASRCMMYTNPTPIKI